MDTSHSSVLVLPELCKTMELSYHDVKLDHADLMTFVNLNDADLFTLST